MTINFTTDPVEIIIHYSDSKWLNKSPCGDKNSNSIVSNEYEKVNCEKCKEVLRSMFN